MVGGGRGGRRWRRGRRKGREEGKEVRRGVGEGRRGVGEGRLSDTQSPLYEDFFWVSSPTTRTLRGRKDERVSGNHLRSGLCGASQWDVQRAHYSVWVWMEESLCQIYVELW